MTDNFEVHKISYVMPVSCCVMTANTGDNHCQHPPPKPLSRYRRIRINAQLWWWHNRPHIHRGPCEVDE